MALSLVSLFWYGSDSRLCCMTWSKAGLAGLNLSGMVFAAVGFIVKSLTFGCSAGRACFSFYSFLSISTASGVMII